MQVQLRDLAPGQGYAIQFRSNDGAGNVSEWSQVQRFTTTSDTMPPGDVTNLTWYNSGTSFIGQWDVVTTNFDGTPLKDFRYYHCVVSNGSTSQDFYVMAPYFEFTQAQNVAAFGSAQTHLTITVTAVDLNYNESKNPTSAVVDTLNPPVPSTPVVGNYLGLLLVSWDGKASNGAAMPQNFNYCEVHIGTTSSFTPSDATLSGRIVPLGSASKTTIAGLNYGQTYYVRLIGVNLLGKKSGASAVASGTPTRISGLDINPDGKINSSQINFTARDIGGANAYYQTSQPVQGVGGVVLGVGDIWYDIDDHYTTYRWDGTTWQPAPEIGVINGTKILAGTVTADAVGTNLLITSQANIANAIIDDAKIASLSASKITSGEIAVDQYLSAGPTNDAHAEMNSTGFYVKGPGPTAADGTVPIVDKIRMGTGVSDYFAIPDPNNPASTLASISDNGIGSFQSLYVQNDLSIGGTLISDAIAQGPRGIIGGFNGSVASGDLGPIQSLFGVVQVPATVTAGRLYRITYGVTWYADTAGDEARIVLLRDESNNTPSLSGGTTVRHENSFATDWTAGRYITSTFSTLFLPNGTGTYSMQWAVAIERGGGSGSVYIAGGQDQHLIIEDVGPLAGDYQDGWATSLGGTFYQPPAAPPPPPPPPPVPRTTYTWSSHWSWVRSYHGAGGSLTNNGYMTNTNGLAYQGKDPSGYNGNQMSLIGFPDVTGMLAGATINSVQLYLYYAHWYFASGGTAVIGYHNHLGDPGTGGFPGGTGNQIQRGGVPKPGSFTIDVSGWGGGFQNGSIRGIMLGPGPSTSETYYGYASDAALTITYTK